MFSLSALEITNILIKINSSEIPIMDGSAKIFVDEIKKIGVLNQEKKAKILKIKKKVKVINNNKIIEIEPNKKNELEIKLKLNYKNKIIETRSLTTFILKSTF